VLDHVHVMDPIEAAGPRVELDRARADHRHVRDDDVSPVQMERIVVRAGVDIGCALAGALEAGAILPSAVVIDAARHILSGADQEADGIGRRAGDPGAGGGDRRVVAYASSRADPDHLRILLHEYGSTRRELEILPGRAPVAGTPRRRGQEVELPT